MKPTFAPGETIQFAAEVSSYYGGPGDTTLSITTSFYNDSKTVNIPLLISTWTWGATAPSEEGNYTVTVQLLDRFCGAWIEASASFAIDQSLPPPGSVPPSGLSTITITPAQGPPGSQVTVRGTGFVPGELIDFTWSLPPYDFVASVQTDGNGTFITEITVPQNAPIG
jgi:hypothetical protein